MNKRQLQINENANIRFLTKNGTERIVFDVMRPTSNSDEHDWMILKVCRELKSQGFKFATEVSIDINGKTRRADVFDFTRGIVIEIQHTESDKSIEEKKLDWESLGFEFIALKIKKDVPVDITSVYSSASSY